MELIKIVNAHKVIDEFADKAELSAHLAYWMTKFVIKTSGERSFYIREAQKIFKQYAEQKEDGAFVIPSGKIEEFNAAIESLNNTDVEDPCIRFNLSELSAELKLSMKQMYPLLDFINEDK